MMAAPAASGEPAVMPIEPAPPQQRQPEQPAQQAQQAHVPLAAQWRQRAEDLAGMFANYANSRSGDIVIRHVSPSALGITLGQTVDEGVVATILPDGTEITVGVPIESSSLNKVVRRVIILASVLATFYVCYFIFNLLRSCTLEQVQSTGRCRSAVYTSGNSSDPTSLWAAISGLLIELSIPACGPSCV